jgi:hypothetical protein
MSKYAYGNCYATSEALYHILGGKKAGWQPMFIPGKLNGGISHWYLRHKETGIILDASRLQFKRVSKIPYDLGKSCGFLTKTPSKRAKDMMTVLTWVNTFKNLKEGVPE